MTCHPIWQSRVDISLLLMCAMTNLILTGHMTARHVFVVILTNYVVDLATP